LTHRRWRGPTGILARTQGLAVLRRALNSDQLCCQERRRREPLLDAPIFFTAEQQAMPLIGATVRHMDLLPRLHPTPNILLYRPTTDGHSATFRA
jgi:hypothetical protein